MLNATLANRLADRALIAFCAANLALLAAFVLSIATAANALSEEGFSCRGNDLVAIMAADAPEKLAAIRKQADAIPNGKAILWKVTVPDAAPTAQPSYVFGTMHSADPRIVEMPQAAEDAFGKSRTVMIESTETLDRANMLKAMTELAHMTLLTDGSLLEESIEQENLEPLKQAVTARNTPWLVANRMQPWLVAATIATPLCELHAKQAGEPVLDTMIGHRTRQSGKTLIGLETIKEQFTAIASVPRDFHVSALNETIRLGDIADDMMETTKQLYLKSEIGMVLPMVRAISPETYRGKGNAEFRELLLSRRNLTMVDRAEDQLRAGGAFMAVGALHLPGEDGIVELLRQRGFFVEAVSG